MKWSFGCVSNTDGGDTEVFVSWDSHNQTHEPKNVQISEAFQQTQPDKDIKIYKDNMDVWNIIIKNTIRNYNGDDDEENRMWFYIAKDGKVSCVMDSTGDCEEYKQIVFEKIDDLEDPEKKELATSFIIECM
jgi:hypothetical protein